MENVSSRLWKPFLIISIILSSSYVPLVMIGNFALKSYQSASSFRRLPVDLSSELYYFVGTFIKTISSVIFPIVLAIVLLAAICLPAIKAYILWCIYAAGVILSRFIFLQWNIDSEYSILIQFNVIETLLLAAVSLLILVLPKLLKRISSEATLFCLCTLIYTVINIIFSMFLQYILTLVIEQPMSWNGFNRQLFSLYHGKLLLKSILVTGCVYLIFRVIPMLKPKKTEHTELDKSEGI